MGAVVFTIILRDLGGWKENLLDEGKDLAPSSTASARAGEGIELGRSCSTKEGSVIVDISSDMFELSSKVFVKRAAVPPNDVGEFRDEEQGFATSDTLKVGA